MDRIFYHVIASQRSPQILHYHIGLDPRIWNRHKHFSPQEGSHVSIIRPWVISFFLDRNWTFFFVSPIASMELTFYDFTESLIMCPASVICMTFISCSCCCWNCMLTVTLKHLYYCICALISSRELWRNICFNITVPESECVPQLI